MEATITVKSIFGKDKQINRIEFVNRWVDEAQQFISIAGDATGLEIVERMKDDARALAGREFDRLCTAQHPRYIFEMTPIRRVGCTEDFEVCGHGEADYFGVYRRPEAGGTADHLEDFTTAHGAAKRIAELYAEQDGE